MFKKEVTLKNWQNLKQEKNHVKEG